MIQRSLVATAALALGAGMLMPVASAAPAAQGDDAGLYGAQDPTFDGVYRQGLAITGLVAVDRSVPKAAVDWLLDQQYRQVHPYTNADPGGWAWTDLPGGVPDADDTPGALLAVLQLLPLPHIL